MLPQPRHDYEATNQIYYKSHPIVFTFTVLFILIRKNIYFYGKSITIEKPVHKVIEEIIDKIKEVRREKGFSLENMADELKLSVSAYNKIENKETKLTFERFLQIQRFLDVPINKLFEIQPETVFNQNIHPNGEGF